MAGGAGFEPGLADSENSRKGALFSVLGAAGRSSPQTGGEALAKRNRRPVAFNPKSGQERVDNPIAAIVDLKNGSEKMTTAF